MSKTLFLKLQKNIFVKSEKIPFAFKIPRDKLRIPKFIFLNVLILCFINPSFIVAQNIITRVGLFDVYPNEEDGDRVTNNMIGIYDSILQKEYVIVSQSDTSVGGLGVFDVTVPSNIQRIGYLNTSKVFGVKVYKNHAYTISSVGSIVDIFDMTNIQNPIYVNSIGGGFHTMVLDMRGFLYVRAGNGFGIYDLTSPANPSYVKSVLYTVNGATWHDGIVKQNKLILFTGSQHTLIYDINDPINPNLIGVISDTSISYSHSGDISEDGNYLFICDETNDFGGIGPDVTVWDISDLNNPTKIGQINDTSSVVHNVYVKGNYLYVAYYKAGFRIYNITNPSNPVLVDEYKTFGVIGPGGIEPFRGCYDVFAFLPSGNIAALDSDSGLFIFSIDYSQLPVENKVYDKTDISIFPNPFAETTTVFVKNNKHLLELNIYDLQGKLLQTHQISDKKFYLHKGNLTSGMYIAEVKKNNVSLIRIKLIKE